MPQSVVLVFKLLVQFLQSRSPVCLCHQGVQKDECCKVARTKSDCVDLLVTLPLFFSGSIGFAQDIHKFFVERVSRT